MQKYVYFFLGLFSATILAVSIFIGVGMITVETIKEQITLVFVVIICLLLVLCIVAFFREKIFEKLGLKVRVGTEDIADAINLFVGDIVNGRKHEAVESSKDVVRMGLSWYSWTSFYRWIIRTSIALLITFTGFAGTILILQQNERIREQTVKLKEQNDLIENQKDFQILSLPNQLRKPFNSDKADFITDTWMQSIEVEQCGIGLQEKKDLYPNPSEGSIKFILQLIDGSSLQNEMIEWLAPLLEDSNPSVRLGALILLDRLNKVPNDTTVVLNNVHVESLTLNTSAKIHFNYSAVSGLKCKNCIVQFYRSIGDNIDVDEISGRQNIFIGVQPKVFKVAEHNLFSLSRNYGGRRYELEATKLLFSRGGNIALTHISGVDFIPPETSCDQLEYFCKYNGFAKCTKSTDEE